MKDEHNWIRDPDLKCSKCGKSWTLIVYYYKTPKCKNKYE